MAVDQQRRATTAGVLVLPGARLAYEVTGAGAPVVLVHGFGLDMRMWDPQVEHLAGRFRVVRYDCRGFGASGPFDPAHGYTHAGDLLALLDHLSIGPAVLALGPQLSPIGHVGQVSDIVNGILFLESSPFITGEILHIDDGQIAGH